MSLNKSYIFTLTGLTISIGASMLWLDRPVALYFKTLDLTMPQLVAPFKIITDAGKSQWYLFPLAGYLALVIAMIRMKPNDRPLWSARLAKAGFVFTSLAVSGLLADGIKILLGRPRPVLLAQDIFNQFAPFTFDARWWSFPSGHSTSVMALALAVSMLTPAWRWPFLVFAGIIMSSRIIIAAHYPSDVMGGVAVAILVHCALQKLFVRRGWNRWQNGSCP